MAAPGAFARRNGRTTGYRSKARARAAADMAKITTLSRSLKVKKMPEAAKYLKSIQFLLRLQMVAGADTAKKARFMAIEQRWILDLTALMLQESTKKIPKSTALEQRQLRSLRKPHAIYLKYALAQ